MRQKVIRRLDLLLLFIFIASFFGWLYVGTYYTLYSIGLYLLIPVVVVGAIAGGLTFLFPNRKAIHALRVGLVTSSALYLLLISSELIKMYKPTYDLLVPAQYEGRVLMFYQEEETTDVMVDEHGIGYVQFRGDFDLDLLHGDRDITDAFKASHSQELIWYNEDSSALTVVNVWCFDVAIGKDYPDEEQPFLIDTCLTKKDFKSLADQGVIDTNRLMKRYHEL